MSSQGSRVARLPRYMTRKRRRAPCIREYLTRDLECRGRTREEKRREETRRETRKEKEKEGKRQKKREGKREEERDRERERASESKREKSKKLIEFYRATVYPSRVHVLSRVCIAIRAGHVCIYTRLQILTAPLSM